MPDRDPPPFPTPPEGVPRLSHRPTVEAGVRYWRSAARSAAPGSEAGRLGRTMAAIYGAALAALERPAG